MEPLLRAPEDDADDGQHRRCHSLGEGAGHRCVDLEEGVPRALRADHGQPARNPRPPVRRGLLLRARRARPQWMGVPEPADQRLRLDPGLSARAQDRTLRDVDRGRERSEDNSELQLRDIQGDRGLPNPETPG